MLSQRIIRSIRQILQRVKDRAIQIKYRQFICHFTSSFCRGATYSAIASAQNTIIPFPFLAGYISYFLL